MTDQTIPAGLTREEARAVREWAERARDARVQDETVAHAARVILDAVPAPPRPTLADMTRKERDGCRWMQADVKDYEITAGIIAKINPTDAHLIASDGETWFLELDTVTPRPDLPRMEWPRDQQAAPSPALPGGWRLADHQKYGRIIVANTTPNIDGYVYIILPVDDPMGYDWHFCKPYELTYIDQESGTSETVPESTLAVGSVWADADSLTRACEETGRDQITVTDCDGDVYVWDANLADWRDLHPIPNYAPFTIIHAGKKADQ